jgi:hypothetical protein
VLQFVLDQEYVVRSPLRDGTRSVSWAQGLAGKEVVVTGRLRLDPYVTAATRKNVVFRVPCVWIYPDVLESSVHVLMQS